MRQHARLIVAAGLVLLATAPLAAQDYRLTDSTSLLNRVEALEARRSRMTAELAALRAGEPAGGCCCYCASHCYWYAGYDNVIVKPHFSRNVAYWENTPRTSQDVFHSFDWDYEYTPRFWIGYVTDCGTGLQFRYWRFDHSTSISRTEGAGEDLEVEVNLFNEDPSLFVDGTLLGEHKIELQVYDLEVVRQGDYCWGWLRASGGLRYAEVDQRGRWSDADQMLSLDHGFEGIGPTLFVEAGVPLGCGNLSAFINGRASILFGDRAAQFRLLPVVNDVGDNLLEYDSQQVILEAQVGVDWSTCLRGSTLSLRAALEAQSWPGAGSATASDDEGIPFDHTDMSFVGGSFSATLFY